MKLLRVSANGFRNCVNGFGIDMIAKSKKTSEDKEYELLEIDEGLYVYSTIAIVGKNASGKTSALELMDWCYDILGTFRLANKKCSYRGITLEIMFYEGGFIYKYITELDNSETLKDTAIFRNQKIYKQKYYKSRLKQILEESWMSECMESAEMPEDFSAIFIVLKKTAIRELYYNSYAEESSEYSNNFKLMEIANLNTEYLSYVFRIFDDKITSMKQLDENNYYLVYKGVGQTYSDKELFRFLSSGTSKGINLYIIAVLSLRLGFDLVVDEIENHFHKTLVENLVMLYKDKKVNKKNATLIFSTHYCELLDLFHRSDNIWITHSKDKMEIDNMYNTYGVRTELLKSKKFYQNAFDTAVNYEALMELKKELME